MPAAPRGQAPGRSTQPVQPWRIPVLCMSHLQHGKVGLLTFCLALASPLLGALSFRRLGLVQRFPEGWQPRLKWLHRLVGLGGGWGVGGCRDRCSAEAQYRAAWCCCRARAAVPLAGKPAVLFAAPGPASPTAHAPMCAPNPLQISVYAYVTAMVAMQLPLPHKAVLTGLWCRAWQVLSAGSATCLSAWRLWVTSMRCRPRRNVARCISSRH